MKVKLIDVDNRLSIKYDQINGIHNWGDDNCYPQLISSLASRSVTAKQCIKINASNIYGKGFNFTQNVKDKSNLIVNKKELNINQLLDVCSKEFAKQNNVFLHLNYNALFQIISVDLIISERVRIGEADSTGYSGKFVVYDNWDKKKNKKIDKKDFVLIDRFNPKPEIIEKQVESAGGWNKYKGQILHLSTDYNEIYSSSDLDAAIIPSYNEHGIDKFLYNGIENGFIGVKFIHTKPFDDEDEAREFEDCIKKGMGGENAATVFLIESKLNSDILKDEIYVQNIDSNIDDARYIHTERSAAEKIRKSFDIHSILIDDSDNSIFGQSGALLKEAKITQWEKKESIRNKISDAFQLIFSKFHLPINPSNDWTITPIIKIEKTASNESNINTI
ncbi:hypothetical protein [Flavobacterium capsici]|uniref:Phage portal protein n=1 Tax=Flavobacterium capsici TaxID=3075618 RepID=A0AA96J6C8_9FLAO|nr:MULTISPECIES: hypothetical protein [unclassified Flavobacterium]WNM18612.1 hypothetical protein RN608_11400 [Flavobacterium sp. PMR2A8]WNM22663.1 hypothetical protein RN605_04700 [Flavobacterium sp. PMTSA4]